MNLKSALAIAAALLMTAACNAPSSSSTSVSTLSGSALYVASGTAYAGLGVTMATPSQTIARYDLNGNFQALIRDYTSSPGDSPVSMVDYDANHILVLVDNASGRRIELVAKDGSGYSTYLTNSTALSSSLRFMLPTPDGGLLVSKSTAIEKFNSSLSRITQGANPFISAPASPCATATTLITSIAIGPSDNIFFTHAASSNTKIDIIRSTGYAVSTDCLAGIATPTTNHYPTAILYHSSGQMLVAYGNNTGPIHQIYSYTTTATNMTAAVQAYNDTSVVQGITALAEMADGSVLVASGASSFNTIEKMTFDPTTGLLTRVGTSPFIQASVFTRSPSSLLIGQ